MKIKNLSLAVISFGAALMLFTACNIDDPTMGSSAGKVIIDVATGNTVETKAGSTTKLFDAVDLSSDGVSLFLSGTESLNNEFPFAPSVETKGSVVVTQNPEDGQNAINSDGQQFNVTVLNNSGIYHTINGSPASGVVAKFDPNGVETKWPLLTEVDWPDEAPKALDFWAYYDMGGNATPSENDYSTYSYLGPTSGNAGMDASKMSDFLVANTVGATQNNVAIHFYHALSAVRFHVDPALISKNFQSLKVRVSGIYRDGEVEYTGDPKQMYFDWDGLTSEVSYEQILLDVEKKNTDGFDENGIANIENSTMFLVPQAVGPSTNVLFTFVLVDWEGHETVLSADNVGTSEWKPGYIYKYNVGQDRYGNVGVEVREGADGNTFDHLKKENVRFEITKSSASYLRVAVIANWCLSNGKIYQGYTGGFDVTSDWVLGSDGFYYSVYPVLGHSESDDFIKEFTPKGTVPTSPYPLNLEMKFLVQAISYDVKADGDGRAAWAWGPVFAKLIADKKVKTELK